jgi:hypothetical protein
MDFQRRCTIFQFHNKHRKDILIKEMYRKGQLTLKLEGIITEFADIYAPIAQLLKK